MSRERSVLTRLGYFVAAAVLVLSCAGDATADNPIISETLRGPFTPEEIELRVDETGWPYDSQSGEPIPDRVIKTEFAGDWFVPYGQVYLMDGISIAIGPSFDAEFSPLLDFDTENLELHGFIAEYDNQSFQGAAGVEIRVAGAEVVRWGPTEFGASTDGGVIGIITAEAVSYDNGVGQVPWMEVVDNWMFDGDRGADPIGVFDLTGSDEVDAAIFSTGGDGGSPMVRGYDADGQMVAAVLFTQTYPWRLMTTEGAMPPDLAALEVQYAECLSGERHVTFSERTDYDASWISCLIDWEAIDRIAES